MHTHATEIKLLLLNCFNILLYALNSASTAPQNIRGEQLNATSVRLHWDSPENPNGVIIGFQVAYYGYETVVQVPQVHYVCMQCELIIHALNPVRFLSAYKLWEK